MTNPLQPRLTILWAQVSGSEIAICDHHAAPLLHIAFERRIEFPFFFLRSRSRMAQATLFRRSRNRRWGGSWSRGGRFQGEGRDEVTFLGSPRLGLLGFFIEL